MRSTLWIHAALILLAFLTLIPFFFALNTAFKTNTEFYHSFFAPPESLRSLAGIGMDALTDSAKTYAIRDERQKEIEANRPEAVRFHVGTATSGFKVAWSAIRPYMATTLFVSALTALGVLALGSATAYVLARYRFLGSRAVFMIIVSTLMFPGVLTLVPSFLLVKSLGLLNTYWAVVLPFVAGGQVFAIFVFKSFFEGLPEELFESARLDGAGHFRLFWNIVLPLSKPAFSVVLVMNVLGTWNSFLWPLIVNPEGKHHMVASGLFVMANSAYAANLATLYAGYALSSLPLLLVLVLATKPFIQGVTTGAFKA